MFNAYGDTPPPCRPCENKSESYAAPWEPTPIFFRSYESSLYLQTLLLLDLWSYGNGLGGDEWHSIKSSSIIYYIEIEIIMRANDKVKDKNFNHMEWLVAECTISNNQNVKMFRIFFLNCIRTIQPLENAPEIRK